jgi:glycine/D-amino acid oxidase-like deaminating enzyme
LTEAARIIVIGAGIVGCGVATYLAQMGWREMLVVNGGPLLGAEDPQVTLASPCSGRGFNFASVVGENLANLVADVEAPCGTSMFHLTALLAAQDDLFAERCTPRPGVRHDIQTS